MKAISFILSAILLSGTPEATENQPVKTVVMQKMDAKSNRDLVELTRASYQEGEFDGFLKEMDRAYQEGVEKKQINGLIDFLKQTGKYSQRQKDPHELERNAQLLALVENEKESLLVEKIRSSATPLKAEVEDAFETLLMIQAKEPGSGNQADENQISTIFLEFLFKRYHLAAQDFDADELELKKQQQIVLEMECFKQLKQASQVFQDETLKQKVLLAHDHLDENLIKNRDTFDLGALYLGIQEPKTDLEKQVVVIFQKAHDASQPE